MLFVCGFGEQKTPEMRPHPAYKPPPVARAELVAVAVQLQVQQAALRGQRLSCRRLHVSIGPKLVLGLLKNFFLALRLSVVFVYLLFLFLCARAPRNKN